MDHLVGAGRWFLTTTSARKKFGELVDVATFDELGHSKAVAGASAYEFNLLNRVAIKFDVDVFCANALRLIGVHSHCFNSPLLESTRAIIHRRRIVSTEGFPNASK